MKRLFSLDIGTGYNMGYNLLNTLTVLVGAGAAYNISGKKTWVAVATLMVLLANFTGSSVFLLYWNNVHRVPGIYDIFDSRLAIDIAMPGTIRRGIIPSDGSGRTARRRPSCACSRRPSTPISRNFTPISPVIL